MWPECTLSVTNTPETFSKISWVPWQRFVLFSQAAVLNWCDTTCPNTEKPRQNAKNQIFWHESDLHVVKPLIKILKLLVNIVDGLNKVLVLISQVAGLNWIDTIYPNLGYHTVQNTENQHLALENDLNVLLIFSHVPQTFGWNSWAP